jgi:hypothetical protein
MGWMKSALAFGRGTEVYMMAKGGLNRASRKAVFLPLSVWGTKQGLGPWLTLPSSVPLGKAVDLVDSSICLQSHGDLQHSPLAVF